MTEKNPFDPVDFAKENMGGGAPTPDPAEVQNKMAQAQEKLGSIEVEGSAGIEDLSVKIYLNGRHEATKVVIEPKLLEQPNEVLCDLIASAITDASHKAEQVIQTEMMKLFQGFDLPG